MSFCYYYLMNEIYENTISEIVDLVLEDDNAKDVLSSLENLDRFVVNALSDNDDFLQGRISTEEFSTMTDRIWEVIGGDNLYDNTGIILRG